MKTYSDFGIEIPYGHNHGQVKTFCPQCHEQRRDKRDKSLSVNLDRGIWHCHHCEWKGSLHIGERAETTTHKEYKKPAPRAIPNLSANLISWFQGRGISQNTLVSLKIGEGEHYMPQTGCNRNTVQFNFYLNGELINVKYRTADKLFALEPKAELIPYNIDSITGQSECIITEGEMDCLSFVEAGFPHCISVPNGASKNLSYLDDFIDGWFEDKKTIYIAVDTDTKGLELREELIRRFGTERCRIVTYGDDCKDANEHLVKYGKDGLANCLKMASDIKIEGVFTVSDIEDSLDNLFQNGLSQGATIGIPCFDKLCSFETKRLAIVTGIPGSGKSEFLDEIAERLNMKYGWKFAFFSPENSPVSCHASKLIEKLTGKPFNPQSLSATDYKQAKAHLQSNFYFISPKDDFSVESILEKAQYLIRRYGIKALVIDPYNRLDLGNTKSKETDIVRDILRTLTVFAQQNDILIFLMAHPTKQPKNSEGVIVAPTLHDIAGSAHFYNMADYGIVVHRNRADNFVEIKVSKVRFKHLGTVGTAKLKYNINNGRYLEYEKGQTPVWDNSNHLITGLPQPTPATTQTPTSPQSTTNTQPSVNIPAMGIPIMGSLTPALFDPVEIPPTLPQHYDI